MMNLCLTKVYQVKYNSFQKVNFIRTKWNECIQKCSCFLINYFSDKCFLAITERKIINAP